MKTFCIKTIGCKVNQYDTQLIRQSLLHAGLKEAGFKDADICIVNTCTVTAKSDKKSRQVIMQLARKNPAARILVTGCGVDNKARAVTGIKQVSQFIKNKAKHRIVELVADEPCLDIDTIDNFFDKDRAFVKIEDGCDNFCSYCIVPYVRGTSRSRPEKEIVAEIKKLIKAGYKEIVLTGINLGHYDRSDKGGLIKLIDKVLSLKSCSRLRLSSLNPEDISKELINKVKSEPRLCRHFHISIQSGDTEILRLMNRKYTREHLLKLLDKIRKAMPDAGISGDFIVGFPQEKEANFKNTLKLLEDYDFVRTHIFTYSPRAGTSSAELEGAVPNDKKKARYRKLKKTSEISAERFMRHFLGKELDVLVESKKNSSTGLYGGYADNYLRVYLKELRSRPKSDKSELIKAKITEFKGSYLLAEPV